MRACMHACNLYWTYTVKYRSLCVMYTLPYNYPNFYSVVNRSFCTCIIPSINLLPGKFYVYLISPDHMKEQYSQALQKLVIQACMHECRNYDLIMSPNYTWSELSIVKSQSKTGDVATITRRPNSQVRPRRGRRTTVASKMDLN